MADEVTEVPPLRERKKRGPYKKRRKTRRPKKPVRPKPVPEDLQAAVAPPPPLEVAPVKGKRGRKKSKEELALEQRKHRKVLPPPPPPPPAPTAQTQQEAEQIDLPLQRRAGESAYAHRSFLLWCMCDPEKRVKREIADIVGYTSAMVSRWAKNNFWDHREALVAAGTLAGKAGRAYLAIYGRSQGTAEVKRLEKILITSYPGVTSLIDGELVKSTDPNERLRKIAEQVENRILQRVEDPTATITIKDLEELKAAKKLRLEIDSMGNASPKDPEKNPLATSVRVERAIASGEDPMDAIQEDHAELGMIFQVLRASRELSNVLPFPMPEVKGKRVRA